MIKGVNQWCFPANYTIKQCLDYSEGLFQCFEPAFTLKGEFSPSSTKQYLEEIKTYSVEKNIEIKSVATGELWNYPLSSKNEKKRRQGVDIVKAMIDAAKILGAEAVLVVPGLVDEENSYDEAYSTSKESIMELKEYAEKNEIVIALENVWNKFLLSPIEFTKFVDGFESNYVKAYFDAGNVLNFGYPQHWIRILGNRIVKVHVKDFKTAVGNITGFTTLYEGDVNWQKVKEELSNTGYEGTLVAEIPPMSDIKLSLKHISDAMDKIINC